MRRYGGARWTLSQTAESYTGALGRRYKEAEESLKRDGPISSKDVLLRCFLKAEKINAGGKFPKPRLIFPRTPRYNLWIASWLKPFEHWLWGNLKSLGNFHVPKTRVVAKGLSPVERANLIVRKWNAFDDPVVLEVDGKAFEAHILRDHLDLEHGIYVSAYRGCRSLQRALLPQLFLKGVAGNGIRFEREAGRASGDFNTGMGNSIQMLTAVDATLETFRTDGSGILRYDTLVDGDNALLFLEARDYVRVCAGFGERCRAITGHEMVLERPVRVIEHIRFGQSAPVWDGVKWRMVRDWKKVLSQGTSSHVHLRDIRFCKAYLAGVAMCEHSLGRGLPILGAWSKTLWDWAVVGGRVAQHSYRDYQAMGVDLDRLREPVPTDVTIEARISFEKAFGVTPDVQQLLEQQFRPPVISEWNSLAVPSGCCLELMPTALGESAL